MVTLLVRLFIEVPADQATEIAEHLRQALEAVVARARVVAVRPYWKIPGYQEVQIAIGGFGDAAQALASVTSHLGTGWVEQSATEAIWNPGRAAEFKDSNVRWAQVEVIE